MTLTPAVRLGRCGSSCRWELLDFALLRRSSVSFFDIERQESAVSKWARARTRAAKVKKVRIISPACQFQFFPQEITDGIRNKSHRDQVGKGLSKDDKAQKLALQHWLEAVSIIRYILLSVRVHVKHVLSHLKC